MKPIKIRHFCNLPVLLILGMVFVLPLLTFFLILGIDARNGLLIFLGGFLLVLIMVGMGFFLNYGIKITSKKVSILFYNEYKNFKYDDVQYIQVGVNDHCIWGKVKLLRQKPYHFVFGDFCLDYSARFPSLSTVKVKISERKAKQIIKKLSACEKVRIDRDVKEEPLW